MLSNLLHSHFRLSGMSVLALVSCIAHGADKPDPDSTVNLGQTISKDEVNSISMTVFPDGEGLPVGSGTAKAGATVYKTQCAHCHGVDGRGNGQFHVPALAGKPKHGSDWSTGYSWPYATSVFDYIQRAMPPYNVKQLSADEVYAVTAYILEMNELVDAEQVIDQKTLPKVEMPASKYFRNKWEEEEQFYQLPEY
ncbi:c-type cytochrome [Aliamphritea ceti]|uniref:c-type cytochrome n=1 Tax=Aliamphritea ceti TaxID=1524258 RepID=UPI0021C41C9B|nr:cytochrome c [Aliamphritea ceti]